MADPITDDLIDMFTDEVTVEPFLSVNQAGDVIYGPPEVYLQVRVIGRSRMAIDSDGNEHVSNVQAMFPGPFGLTARDRYTLPLIYSSNPRDSSDLASRQPQAIAVDRTADENGPHHEIVYFSNVRSRVF
jgi:hypothetical protein